MKFPYLFPSDVQGNEEGRSTPCFQAIEIAAPYAKLLLAQEKLVFAVILMPVAPAICAFCFVESFQGCLPRWNDLGRKIWYCHERISSFDLTFCVLISVESFHLCMNRSKLFLRSFLRFFYWYNFPFIRAFFSSDLDKTFWLLSNYFILYFMWF